MKNSFTAICFFAMAFSGLLLTTGLTQADGSNEFAKLLPNDGAPNELFGRLEAIDGTTAIVGASAAQANGIISGAVYLFDTETGLQVAKHLPSDGAAFDFFGYSVAVSGDRRGNVRRRLWHEIRFCVSLWARFLE
ncbi:MAG: hypothetical protein ACI8TQ_002483 [Planctomycetota bacterium]|jgi:hypothetical protein